MTDKPQATASSIIRDALKVNQLTYVSLGAQIGERPEKISIAVRCGSGLGKRAIEIRKKVAAALALDPSVVWDELYLHELSGSRARPGAERVAMFSQVSHEEWAAMKPRERLRSLLAEYGPVGAREFAVALDIPTRAIYNSVHRSTGGNPVREKIANWFGCEVHDIWGENEVAIAVPLHEILASHPEARAFYGFGDLTKPIVAPIRIARSIRVTKVQKPNVRFPKLPESVVPR